MKKLNFGELAKYINDELYHMLCEQIGAELLSQEQIDEINEYMKNNVNETCNKERLPWECGHFATKSGITFVNASKLSFATRAPEDDETVTKIVIPFKIDKNNKVKYRLFGDTALQEVVFADNGDGQASIKKDSNGLNIHIKHFTSPDEAIKSIYDILNDDEME